MGALEEMADWSAGSLFGCFDDPGACFLAWCCPGVVYGQTNDTVEEGSCVKACLTFHFCGLCTACCYAPERRKEKFIAAFGLNSGSCTDNACLTWGCCGRQSRRRCCSCISKSLSKWGCDSRKTGPLSHAVDWGKPCRPSVDILDLFI